jgi:subtilisin family serine protease
VKLDHPQARRWLIIVSIASAVVLIAAGGALWYLTRTSTPRIATATPLAIGSPPPINITPPPSLEDIANQYPKIAKLLRDPALASAYKEFLLAYQQGGLPAAETLARERGLLGRNREVRITLVLDSAVSVPAVNAELEKLGIIIEGTYKEMVDIAVPLMLIDQASKQDDPGQVFSQLSGMEHVVKLRLPVPNRTDSSVLPSEGVTTTSALAWHKAGYTGQGIKIGVLDLGFDGYKNLLGKTLPDKVTVKSFVSGQEVDQAGEVHGAACAEIVHAMAPDAQLYLAYYNGSVTGLGRAAEWLAEQGVQIISHSASGLLGPMDGSGPQAQLVDDMASRGILWVNASGNSATEHYRFTFNDKKGNGKHTFPDGSQALLYKPPTEDARIILNWDDWSGNASEDYDLVLYDESGQVIAASEDTQRAQPKDIPVEVIRLDKPARKSYYIVIIAKHITHPAVFDLYAHNGKLGYYSADHSLGTPADARGALTVGAIAWHDNKLEPFSSQGPTNDGRLKPELVAPDRVTTRSYRGEIFPGTSASTPHVAGAAALVLSRYPTLKATEMLAWLESNAMDMGPTGPDTAYGYGRLQLPSPTQAQTPVPIQSRTPVIVTAQPIVEQPPEAHETSRNGSAAIGVLACLSGLMCAGVIGSLGGLALLVFVARPRPVPVRPAPPVMPVPAQPYWPQPPAAPMTALALVNPNGMTIAIRPGKLSIGRSPDNDIHLDDSQISRQQAELAWDGSRCTIADLGSRNGTFVNGRRLMPHIPEAIRPGDRIAFGTASIWTVTWNP